MLVSVTDDSSGATAAPTVPVATRADHPSWLPVGLQRRVRHLVRRGRQPGLRTAKTTAAAVLSFVIAGRLGTSEAPILAPLTALLVVQLTMYQTIRHGLDRIASVLAGVLLAVGVAEVAGLTWWSLGIVVAASLVLGRLLRLGANLLEVPISAMIVLAVGGNSTLAAGRVYETLVGAAVGIAVNIVIAPPLYVQPAADALGELADRVADVLSGLAGELRRGWSRAAADHWLEQARALGAEVARADRTLASAQESSRFNPRGSRARVAQPRLRTGLTGLEHGYVALRSLCRALLDRAYFVPSDQQGHAYDEQARVVLADALDRAADAVSCVGAYAGSSEPAQDQLWLLGERLSALQADRDRLSGLLMVDPAADEAAWQQHGALLAGLDRLRVEIASAAAPSEQEWRPAPVAERQRQALRRVIRPGRSSESPTGSPAAGPDVSRLPGT